MAFGQFAMLLVVVFFCDPSHYGGKEAQRGSRPPRKTAIEELSYGLRDDESADEVEVFIGGDDCQPEDESFYHFAQI